MPESLAWLLLVPAVLAVASWPGSPGELAPLWLAAGPAAAIALRRSGLAVALAQGGLLVLAQLLAQHLDGGMADANGWAALGAAVVLTVQAQVVGERVRGIWHRQTEDSRPPALRRLAAGARLIFVALLPWGLLAGGALAGLHGLGHQGGWAHGGPAPTPGLLVLLRLALTHALASTLCMAIGLVLLSWDRWRRPGWPQVLGQALAAFGLAAATGHWPMLLAAAPVLAFLAGWQGGFWSAVWVTLWLLAGLLGPGGAAGPDAPFEGPDGFLLFFNFAWRLLVIALLGTLWNEPRQRRPRTAARRSGAQIVRDLSQLQALLQERGFGRGRRAARRLLWLHIDLPADRDAGRTSELGRLDDAALDEPVDGGASAWPSARLPSLMRKLSGHLRSQDLLVPIAGEAAVVLVDGIPDAAIEGLIERIDLMLLREGAAHSAPAQLRRVARLEEAAAALLLGSARYFCIDAEDESGDPR